MSRQRNFGSISANLKGPAGIDHELVQARLQEQMQQQANAQRHAYLNSLKDRAVIDVGGKLYTDMVAPLLENMTDADFEALKNVESDKFKRIEIMCRQRAKLACDLAMYYAEGCGFMKVNREPTQTPEPEKKESEDVCKT
jgi:hypothetical protein